MDPPPEGHLRLVPCDPHAPFLARALLPELQHAVRHQRGLLLLHLPAYVVQSSRLAALRERRGGASFAAVGSAPNPSAFFVTPDSAPEAAAALHALGSELTKAHMLRMGRRSTELEPFLDPLQDWLQPRPGSDERVHCRLLLSTTTDMDAHMDRGLFNIVVGRHVDIGTLQLNLPEEDVDVWKLLPPSAVTEEDELLALVIPGYTLQCVDPSVPAVLHSVPHRQEAMGRAALVLQWRLHPQYQVGAATVGQLMEQFSSVRTTAQHELADRRSEQYRAYRQAQQNEEPAVPAAPGYWVYVRTMTGQQHTLVAHPEWTVLNLKWGVWQLTGIPTDQMRLIFHGRCPEDPETLAGCGITNRCTVCLVLKLRGD